MSASNCLITGSRFIALAVPNFDEVLDFYTKLWGLVVVEMEPGLAYLAAPEDTSQYVLRLRQSDDKRVDLIGLSVATRDDVNAYTDRMKSMGVRIDREPAELNSPGGGYGLRFFDCDGRLIEVSADVKERIPTEPLVANVPRHLSHLVFNTPDIDRTLDFYLNVIGLKLSDWLEHQMCFLRGALPQHHIIALSKGPHYSLNHLSWEMGDLDSYLRGSGRLIRAGYEILWGPGRHGAGDNAFSYFLDPAGNVTEYTTELEEVLDDETWEVRTFAMTPEASDQWGTGGLPTDKLIPTMFNEPDSGLWKSSPV